VLRYRAGDWNALRRGLFGDLVFSLQVVVGLDEYGTDYTGGEFSLAERRSRAQSRCTSTVLPQGHSLIFTTHDRPGACRLRLVRRPSPLGRQHRPLRPPPRPMPRLLRRLGLTPEHGNA
jgi:hypothetical protein